MAWRDPVESVRLREKLPLKKMAVHRPNAQASTGTRDE